MAVGERRQAAALRRQVTGPLQILEKLLIFCYIKRLDIRVIDTLFRRNNEQKTFVCFDSGFFSRCNHFQHIPKTAAVIL
jgi:hypothetical protein